MMLVKGAFTQLILPGLREAWEAATEFAEERTGVFEVELGSSQRRGIRRRPLRDSEEYPPKDWPDY